MQCEIKYKPFIVIDKIDNQPSAIFLFKWRKFC